MKNLVLSLAMIAGASSALASNNSVSFGFECPNTVKAQVSCVDDFSSNLTTPSVTKFEGIYVKVDEDEVSGYDRCQYDMVNASPLEFFYQGRIIQFQTREELRAFLESVPEYQKYQFKGFNDRPKSDSLDITYYRKSFSSQRVAKVHFLGILEQFKINTGEFNDISSNLETPYISHISGFDITTGRDSRLVQVGGGFRQQNISFGLRISGDCEVKLSNANN